ncbi:MAG: hypothetical protein ACKVS6_05115 [Planctomycetota bacterium]
MTLSLAIPAILACLPVFQNQLAIVEQPANSSAGTSIAPAIKVALQEAGGTVVPLSGVQVTLSFNNNPAGGTLSGTLTKTTAGGIAIFENVSINKSGSGYSLIAAARFYLSAPTAAFDINAGAPARLKFVTNPPNVAAWEPAAQGAQVIVLDAFDNIVTNVNIPITIQLGSNPGVNLVHASGMNAPILELIDPETPALLPPIVNPGPKNISAMVYDPSSGKLMASDTNNLFNHINPFTGAKTVISPVPGLPQLKGLAFEPETGALLGASIFDNVLYNVNPNTGVDTPLGVITISRDSIQNLSSLATDPTTGIMYGTAQTFNFPATNRQLITIDPATLHATSVGSTNNRPAGLAFLPDGTLIAVTGDGGSHPEQLFTVNKSTGSLTHLLTLGNGDNGEAIATIPAQLRGTTNINSSSGTATFNNYYITARGNNYSLVASSPGLANAASRPFDVAPPDVSGIVTFSTAAQSANENAGTISIILTLDSARAHDVVAWLGVTGSANGLGMSGADHNLSKSLDIPFTIPAGQASASMPVNIINDSNDEPNETVIITIKRVALGTAGAAAVHTITILDND